MASDSDKRYKKIFSHPLVVEELLLYFVHEDFVKDLDFSTLERLDKSFVTEKFQEKESDIIYKVNFKDNEIYIYLLIEFQSTVDKFMPLRILRYILEFYDFLSQNDKFSKLPAVFPILLYNGEDKWTAKENISDIIVSSIPKRYIPNFSYYKLIENEISKETLLKIHNFVSAIFYVENSTPEQIKSEIRNIISLIEKERPDLIKLFRLFINNLFKTSNYNNIEEVNQEIDNIMEVKTMLEMALKRRDEQIREDVLREMGNKIIETKIETKIETASKMIEKGLSLNLIIECTGLSEDEIKKLLH
ncbi:MAG: hypothetical protein A2086_12150 [Spirochaetes bacterium GWD1_27_9]|nr:MAG: hypothetical protein A2Z98_05350 [Spirochaetes bacterium GWB1_27_13]OHD28981.1 MAG: hypothetical protein A2086_12150 [Spirochaetes bacterium GWD1_27_9]